MSSFSDPARIAALHKSVLFEEVLDLLIPVAGQGGLFLDGTLGLGGHSQGILRKAGPGAGLLGLDRDAEALALAGERLAPLGAAVILRQAPFAEFSRVLDEIGWDKLDGALLDLGVSSLQLDKPERGFSFLHDGPLDMRMDPSGGLEPASALVNRLPVARLKEIFEVYGEEPQAGRIARAIDDARAQKPLESTLELARVVEAAYPPKWRATARNHPATRAFQALRLAVNGELEQLESFLRGIVARLKPGGRVAVISFHSLEDRLVKHFFRAEATDCICPPRLPRCVCGHRAALRLITKKSVTASEEERAANTRARSARLRVAERTENPCSGPADFTAPGPAGTEDFFDSAAGRGAKGAAQLRRGEKGRAKKGGISRGGRKR